MSVQTIVTVMHLLFWLQYFLYIFIYFLIFMHVSPFLNLIGPTSLSLCCWTWFFFLLKISFNGFLCSGATGDLGVLKLYMSHDDQWIYWLMITSMCNHQILLVLPLKRVLMHLILMVININRSFSKWMWFTCVSLSAPCLWQLVFHAPFIFVCLFCCVTWILYPV